MQLPDAAIPPEEIGASFAALAVLLAVFGHRPRVAALFDAIGDTLAAEPPAVH